MVPKQVKDVRDERAQTGSRKKHFLALEPLRERDVTVALDIYAGPLRKGRKAIYA